MRSTHRRQRYPGGLPLARRVRDLLRARLLAGEFGLDRLPDDEQLMHDYGVGRNVIRTALSALQADGLIERKQGTGTFARSPKSLHRLVHTSGLGGSLPASWMRIGTRLLSAEEIHAPAELARELEVKPGSTCLAVDALVSVDGNPAIIQTSYLADAQARERLRAVIGVGVWHGDWYAALEEAGLGPTRREVLVEAVVLDDLVAPLLDVAVGSPAMRFQRRLWLGDDGAAEFGFAYCRGDLFSFVLDPGPGFGTGVSKAGVSTF